MHACTHTHSGQHQREGEHICLHKVHKTCPLVHTDTLSYCCLFLQSLMQTSIELFIGPLNVCLKEYPI